MKPACPSTWWPGPAWAPWSARCAALGNAPDVILDRCRAWTRERPWSDYTLPLASIVRGRRIRRALAHLLGDTRIEDLWLPYACVTANLTRATADTHTTGPLVRLVLASNSVPGLAPPVHYEGDRSRGRRRDGQPARRSAFTRWGRDA